MAQSPLAYQHLSFLEGPDARPLRILAEYLEPLQRFRQERVQDTIVFFGSARVHSREHAEQTRRTLETPDRPRGADHEGDVRRSIKAVEWADYYEDARELARLLASWSRTLPFENHRFVVTSGGGPGIMEAANRGAREGGGKTIGMNIRLPFEQEANPYISENLRFDFHYFFMRKFWFASLAKALVVFPGGFGTCDELFEILTLVQTGKLSTRVAVVLYGREYWDRVLNFDLFAEWGAISESDLTLMHRADTPTEAFTLLRDALTTEHLEPRSAEEAQAPGIVDDGA